MIDGGGARMQPSAAAYAGRYGGGLSEARRRARLSAAACSVLRLRLLARLKSKVKAKIKIVKNQALSADLEKNSRRETKIVKHFVSFVSFAAIFTCLDPLPWIFWVKNDSIS